MNQIFQLWYEGNMLFKYHAIKVGGWGGKSKAHFRLQGGWGSGEGLNLLTRYLNSP